MKLLLWSLKSYQYDIKTSQIILFDIGNINVMNGYR